MFKIISASKPKSENLDLFLSESPLDKLLQEAVSLISDNLGTKDIPVDSKAGKVLTNVRVLIGKAALLIDEKTRSRSSSLTSTGSLGDRVGVCDKEDYLSHTPGLIEIQVQIMADQMPFGIEKITSEHGQSIHIDDYLHPTQL